MKLVPIPPELLVPSMDELGAAALLLAELRQARVSVAPLNGRLHFQVTAVHSLSAKLLGRLQDLEHAVIELFAVTRPAYPADDGSDIPF